jgi:hypothetical protein
MILRVLNFVVIGVLVLAAAWVYRIKFEAAAQAEHLAKLRVELRRERDKIAVLRAEWAKLDDPARIEALAQRFLQLRPLAANQFSSLDHLPPQPPAYMRGPDPLGGLIEHLQQSARPAAAARIPASAAPNGKSAQAAANHQIAESKTRSLPPADSPLATGAGNP